MDAIQSSCASLPSSGRIACSLCHAHKPIIFDETRTESEKKDWRITANPLAWGNPRPEVLVLGFSKGPSQADELKRLPHHAIPYRKGRMQVGKILAHIGLLPSAKPEELKRMVEQAVANESGRFGWGSLVRCTVERDDAKKRERVGSGGMIDQFMATPFGEQVSTAGAPHFLSELPTETKLIIMFGLGAGGSYVHTARKAIEKSRPGSWLTINEIAYTDDKLTFFTSNISRRKARTFQTGLAKTGIRERGWASSHASLSRSDFAAN